MFFFNKIMEHFKLWYGVANWTFCLLFVHTEVCVCVCVWGGGVQITPNDKKSYSRNGQSKDIGRHNGIQPYPI